MEATPAAVPLNDGNFDDEVIRSPLPVLVHFTLENDYDKQMTVLLGEVMQGFGARVKTGVLNIAVSSTKAQEFGVGVTPTLLIFSNEHVVGYKIGLVGPDAITQMVARVLDRSQPALPPLMRSSLAKAFRDARYHGEWSHVVLSAVAVAVASRFAFESLQLGSAILVGGLAYSILIANPRMGFTLLQKIVATGLTFALLRYGSTILQSLRSLGLVPQ